MNKNVLFVDDEYDVISAYKRNLRKHFNVKTANSGKESLEILSDSEEFAVVVTDFRMPEIDGIQLLTEIQRLYPDTVRIIITGHADLQTAINAVNKGNIFRFLTKPIPTEDLISVVNDSIELFRLKKSEKELLNKTLSGVINILVEIQSQLQPFTVQHINRTRKLGRRIVELIKLPNSWEFDIALMLSKLGYVVVPPEIMEKQYKGEPFTQSEERIFNSYPQFSADLIKRIPRLENVAKAIEFQLVRYDGSNSPDKEIIENNIPVISRILKIINDYDYFLNIEDDPQEAIIKLQENSSHYDPKILNVLFLAVKGIMPKHTVLSVKFKELRIGMTLVREIKDTKGNTLVKKGTEITDMILMKLIHAAKVRDIYEPILVIENI